MFPQAVITFIIISVCSMHFPTPFTQNFSSFGLTDNAQAFALLPRRFQNMAKHCHAEQGTVKTCLRRIVFLCFPQETRNITCLSDWYNHKRTKFPYKHQSQFHFQEAPHMSFFFSSWYTLLVYILRRVATIAKVS